MIDAPFMALSASAPLRVQESIIESLCLRSPDIISCDLNKANIFLSVSYILGLAVSAFNISTTRVRYVCQTFSMIYTTLFKLLKLSLLLISLSALYTLKLKMMHGRCTISCNGLLTRNVTSTCTMQI